MSILSLKSFYTITVNCWLLFEFSQYSFIVLNLYMCILHKVLYIFFALNIVLFR